MSIRVVGQTFAFIALAVGIAFFIYAAKYYISVAIVLLGGKVLF